MNTYKTYFSIGQDSSKQKQITILSFDRLYTTCVVDVKLMCSNFMLSLLVYCCFIIKYCCKCQKIYYLWGVLMSPVLFDSLSLTIPCDLLI